jgi:hypothetical protein
MNKYPYPCDKCKRKGKERCEFRECKPWRTRYLHRQKQINEYAKRVLSQSTEGE